MVISFATHLALLLPGDAAGPVVRIAQALAERPAGSRCDWLYSSCAPNCEHRRRLPLRKHDAQAAQLVGDLYVRSGSLPPNYTEAAKWYRRAAEAGHQAAARALGSLYLTGAGLPQDAEEAARWLGAAAEVGDPASQVDLANLVLQGHGGEDDPARVAGPRSPAGALELFEKAEADSLTAIFIHFASISATAKFIHSPTLMESNCLARTLGTIRTPPARRLA
jgi:TPR repeat protein